MPSRKIEQMAESLAILPTHEIESRIAVAEQVLSSPRVRGAYRDRQIMNTGRADSDAKLVSATRMVLEALTLVRSERVAA